MANAFDDIEMDWLKRWSEVSPQKIAVRDLETGTEVSYEALHAMSIRCAHTLKTKFQVRRGDRVALLAQNAFETLVSFFAVQRLGAILVPLNFRLTTSELEPIILDCAPRVLIVQEALRSNLTSNTQESLKGTVCSWGVLEAAIHEKEKVNKYNLEFNAEFERPCLLLYTSGTTGKPKGVQITPKMIFWNSVNTSLRLDLSQKEVTLNFLPFFHTGAWNVLTLPVLHRGGTVLLLSKFDPERVLKACAAEKVSILFGVPTTMDLMARTSFFDQADLRSVRYAIVGGEPMPLPLIQRWAEKNIPVRQGYGLTEFGPNVFSLNEEDALRKMGSIGFENFYVQTKIVDDAGADVGPNEVGELALRGPMCTSGYWNQPEETARVIRDGWLYTGDLVKRDAEGYCYVVGRKKDMFISGGENIYPVEIEQVLRAHPRVLECAVVGIPDSKWGEVGCAYVVAKPKTTLSEQECEIYCREHLARYKVPKYFKFMDALPKGDSGKILKTALRSALLSS